MTVDEPSPGLASGETADLEPLAAKINYRFTQPELLERAVTHRSRVNEDGGEVPNNERLEFLGDAVIDVIVSEALMERLPQVREGRLSKLRARIVSESGLAEVARALNLGAFLRLGRGEAQTGGRDKPSILADATEALVGAVYLDGGFATAHTVVTALLGDLINRVLAGGLDRDHKTRLQELAQGKHREVPVYQVVAEQGPDHAKTFEVSVSIVGQELARASGSSKKEAEQQAAAAALKRIEQDGGP